jgi:outer membrane biosynthesis protein TonB
MSISLEPVAPGADPLACPTELSPPVDIETEVLLSVLFLIWGETIFACEETDEGVPPLDEGEAASPEPDPEPDPEADREAESKPEPKPEPEAEPTPITSRAMVPEEFVGLCIVVFELPGAGLEDKGDTPSRCMSPMLMLCRQPSQWVG